MLIDNFLAMLADIPPTLAAGWALWMVVGLLLSRWHLQSRSALVYQQNEPWPLPRRKSTVRTPAPAPVIEEPIEAPPADIPGDPFADLERIFEEKVGSHRMPGEAALLDSAGAPLDASEPETTQGRA